MAWLLEGESERQVAGGRARPEAREGPGLRLPDLGGGARRCGTCPSSSGPSTRAWATCSRPGTSTSPSTTRAAGLLSFPYFADERDPTPAPEAPRPRAHRVRPAHPASRSWRRPRSSATSWPAARSSSSRATRWTGWGRRSSPGGRRSGSPPSRPTTRRCAWDRRSGTSSSSSPGRSRPPSRRSARRTPSDRARPGSRSRSSRSRPCCGRPTRSCASPRPSARGSPPSASPRTRWWASRSSSTSALGSSGLERHRLALRGESVGYEYEMEGRAFTVHVEPLRDAAGAVRGTVGIAVDITDLRRADQGAPRLRGSAAAGHRPRAPLHLREGRGGALPARQPRGGRGLRHDRGPDLIGPHRRGLRPLRRGGAPLPGGRPGGDAERPAQGASSRSRSPTPRGGSATCRRPRSPSTFSGTGRPAVLGVSIDITERKAAEEALRRAAKEESLAVLAGGVAHDFNNLLAAILGHASLAIKQLPRDEPRPPPRREGGGGGRAGGRPHPPDAGLLGAGALRGAADRRQRPRPREPAPPRGGASRRACASRRSSPPSLPLVDADVGQVQQVLMNLVINAAEAIGDRGGTRHPRHGSPGGDGPADHHLWRASGQPLAPGPYVALEVRDDGPGHGRGDRGPDLRALLHDQVHRARPRPRRRPRRRAGPPGRAERRERAGAGARPSGILFAPSARAARGGEPPPPPAPERRRAHGPPDRRRGRGARHGRGGPGARGDVRSLRAEDGARGVALFREARARVDVVLLDLSMPGLSGEETFHRLVELDPAVRVDPVLRATTATRRRAVSARAARPASSRSRTGRSSSWPRSGAASASGRPEAHPASASQVGLRAAYSSR